MHRSEWMKTTCASLMLAAALIVQPAATFAQDRPADGNGSEKNLVEIAPKSSDLVALHTLRVEDSPYLAHDQKLDLLRKHIKYVFVLFQENRSFDFYFGTYPGANGLFSQPAAETPGFTQPIVNTDGTVSLISPFKIPQSVTATTGSTVLLYPEDTDSVNHGHAAIDEKLDLNAGNVAQNDRYAFTEEGLKGTLSADGTTYTGPLPTLAQKQKGELVVSHVDCDTAPFLWNYADRFTLFDNFFDTVIGPSTPNAIAMIAGQSGETQWVKHPALANNVNSTNAALPVTGDPQPFWGSALDVFTPPSQMQPTESGAPGTTNPSSNLTFATLPLSFMGEQIENITTNDLDPAFDLVDVQGDIKKIAGDHNKPVNWAWFQEGYDHESTDPTATASHTSYIAHHDAPQYFGYEANNPVETKAHLKGLGDFFAAISAKALPAEGGVFYVRGGYDNLDGLTPRSPSPTVKAAFSGNDDHPGYSDAQISEALLADEINAIASSKYWPESAIIITYDESDGLYDHAQPKVRSWDPSATALDQGPRIPAIVISPYSKVHVISHEATEHGSIIKFIDQLFNLTPLADLPDEAAARALGEKTYTTPQGAPQKYLGPSDAKTPGVGNLFTAFDNARLLGVAPKLEASYAEIPAAQVTSLPHFGANGCRVLGIVPTDVTPSGLLDPAPADFNPRPSSNPGLPTSGAWPSN
ncbi:MAG: alkaline phosphatase family protein [Terracidiphilus sp.]|jgi:phospholipase C